MPSNQQVIAVGDFNHDGNLDIVVTSQDDNTVLVLLNNSGDGTFQDGYVKYDVGAFPVAVAVGDFNNDGNLDIVTANNNGTISVLLGQGDGTFQQPSKTMSVSPFLVSIAVGDFNRDGVLDIVTNGTSEATVTVLLGQGDGTFQVYQRYAIGDSSGAVAVGDLTHDGNLDIVTTNGHFAGNAVTVSPGNGDGTFQSYQDYDVSSGPAAVALGDVNHDGVLDIVTASPGGSLEPRSHNVSVLLGQGDGTFQSYQDYSLDSVDAPIALALGDFTGNGVLDIVTGNGYFNNHDLSTVSLLLNQGDGTFQSPQTYYSLGAELIALAVGDFTNDGNLDIVTANQGDAIIAIFYGNGDGTFGPAPYIRQR